jgi:hypothetical protein
LTSLLPWFLKIKNCDFQILFHIHVPGIFKLLNTD